jgi:RHS repeat-associated protein
VADGVRQQFTGHERDSETGLDFMQARYYASGQGRFASADEPFADQWESDPRSWNLYTYVRNNPCVNIDPRGRETCYYTQSGSKIGCETDKRIRIEDKSLIFTPKKGATPIVYDLDQINASFTVRPGRPGANDLAFEMQQRAPAIKQSVVVFAGGSALIGTGIGGAAFKSAAIGGFLLGPGLTTLNIGVRVGSTVWATGQAFERVIQTSQGPVQVYADIIVQGSKVTLKDLLVYPQNSAANLNGIFKELIRARSDLIRELKSQGFTELRIVAERAAQSLSKNPGHQIDITIPLK